MTTEERLATLERLVADLIKNQRTTSTAAPTLGDVVRASGPKTPFDPSNPTVKISPKSWRGEDMRGRRFSECPADFLLQLSKMLDAFADKNADDPDPQKQRFASWDRSNALKAREWAAKKQGKQDLFAGDVDALADSGAF